MSREESHPNKRFVGLKKLSLSNNICALMIESWLIACLYFLFLLSYIAYVVWPLRANRRSIAVFCCINRWPSHYTNYIWHFIFHGLVRIHWVSLGSWDLCVEYLNIYSCLNVYISMGQTSSYCPYNWFRTVGINYQTKDRNMAQPWRHGNLISESGRRNV